jgi:hypothetical protein
MQALRRAIGRKDVIFALAVFLVAGGWFGWHQLIRPVLAQVGGTSSLKDLLDAGQFAQVISQADTMLAVHPAQPQVLRYKAIAQHLTGPSAGALQTVEAAPSAGASEADLSVLLAVKALELAGYDYQQIPEAKQAAAQALGLAGGDADAGLLARVACAAAQRCEMDDPGQAPNLSQHVAQIARVLEPLYAAGATEPQAVWASRLWQRGLALMADTQMLAGAAGDPTGEPAALALLKRLCPQDAWACYFSIPAKALAVVQSGTLDDHARAAMLTATGFLYVQIGDRLHGDAAFRRAVQVYGQLLEQYDGWQGDPKQIVTPKGVPKTVGSQEFHDYRNRMERLAKYSADWWGIRVARGQVDLPTALAACDHKLFRAIVRVRADRQANPVKIMYDENIRPVDFLTVADWFLKRAYDPQADWEKARAQVLQTVGDQEVAAFDAFQEANSLAAAGAVEDALGLLATQLQVEPALAETGISLRCEMAHLLASLRRMDEANGMLDAAQAVLEAGDEYLDHYADYLQGRILSARTSILMGKGDTDGAIQLAWQIAQDETIDQTSRTVALARLVGMNVRRADMQMAKAAYDQLGAFPAVDPAVLEYTAKCMADAQTASATTQPTTGVGAG